MAKYTEIKILVKKNDDGSILFNTGDGIQIVVERDSHLQDFYKCFDRALDKTTEQKMDANELLPLVNNRLWGVYSPEEDLLAVHKTAEGANENSSKYKNAHGEGFYVDYVIVND